MCISTPVSQFIPPTLFFLLVYMFVLYVCVSTSVLQILSITFSRFHIHALIYDICFSVSDFTHFFFICSEFCHTLEWNSHGFTCVPHPDPPSHLPLHPLPLGFPSAPGPSTCLMHPTWAGDLLHPRYHTCFNAVLLKLYGIGSLRCIWLKRSQLQAWVLTWS